MLEGAFEAFVKVVSKQNVANVVYGHVNFVDEFGNNIRKIYHLHYHRFMTFLVSTFLHQQVVFFGQAY